LQNSGEMQVAIERGSGSGREEVGKLENNGKKARKEGGYSKGVEREKEGLKSEERCGGMRERRRK